jgi:hypothetical protein
MSTMLQPFAAASSSTLLRADPVDRQLGDLADKRLAAESVTAVMRAKLT